MNQLVAYVAEVPHGWADTKKASATTCCIIGSFAVLKFYGIQSTESGDMCAVEQPLIHECITSCLAKLGADSDAKFLSVISCSAG